MKSDYIVVGAGSAGSALASRLSEDPAISVTVIEAGPSNDSWTIDMPLAVDRLVTGTRYNWSFATEPEKNLGGRSVDHPRGKVLGGSSSINGMVYTRGNPFDFDRWAGEFGCEQWSYAHVLPYFMRCETSDHGPNRYRGGAGPLHVTTPDLDANPLNRAFMLAGRVAGYPVTADSNAFSQEGFGPNEQTIYRGRRWSAANAYLSADVRRRPNLRILTDTRAERLVVTNGKVTGVRIRQQESVSDLTCEREVIVCGGAISSPHLLLVSGIGPRAVLAQAGVDPVHVLEGVGQNLQDHPDWMLQVECTRRVTLFGATRFPQKYLVGIQWFLRKSGIAASNQFEAAAYIRTRAGIRTPNLKLELLPLAFAPGGFAPYDFPAYQIHMTLQTAESRGQITLKGADPALAPRIEFNYLDAPNDLQTMREAVRLTREIVASPPLAALSGRELQPGVAIQEDAALDDWLRRHLNTAYHPAGTCKMGPATDPMAVVGPDLKVHGLDGLRVADASIMPMIVAANLNAACIMIGDRAGDIVRGRKPLPPDPAPYYMNANWETAQR